MTVLTANLTHLYRRPGKWFYCLCLLFLAACFSSFKIFSENLIAILLTLIPVLTVIYMSSITDVLNKPMSFCLPDHQRIVRRLCVLVWIVLSVLIAGLFIRYPANDRASVVVMVITGFFTSTLLYWMSVYLTLRQPKGAGFIVWLIFILPWIHKLSLLSWIERYRWILIALGAMCSAIVWVWLGQREPHRRICGVPYLGLFDMYNINKAQKIQQQHSSPKIMKTQKWEAILEPWILRRISAGGRGVNVLIWRAVYTFVGPFLPYWKQAIIIWILFAVCFSYLGWMRFIVSFCIGFSLAMIDLRIYANAVRELDRRQLYVSSLVGGMVLLVFALLIISGLTAITHCIAPWMPAFDIRGKHIPFVALSWTDLVYPVLLIPAGLLAQLFFYRSRWLMFPVVMGAAFGFLGAFAAGGETVLFTEWGWFSLCAACLLLWICFACALRYVCRKFDLIKL